MVNRMNEEHTAFMSASLDYGDRPVMDFFRRLLFENRIRPLTIGIDIPATDDREAARLVVSETEKVDCVVAILTERYLTTEGEKKPSEWLPEEAMTGSVYGKPVYIFHEKGLTPRGASVARARWVKEFDKNSLEEQRPQLSAACSQIRADLAEKKSQEFWALVQTIAVGIGAVGAGYLLYRALRESEE
jgi:hypothetical protein